MKNKMFDFRLYLQGLNRLRVIGLALAILCITVSMLVPTIDILNGPRYGRTDYVYLDGDEVVLRDGNMDYKDREFYEHQGALVVPAGPEQRRVMGQEAIMPVLIASYTSPILMLMMFAFLNKRKESDFYHAIPLRRSCVYISFTAATLTWMLGVLTVSALAAALIWTLNPHATLVFGNLLLYLLYACLNAILLAAFTGVAVSLTGTVATSIVTTLLVTGIWRVLLYLLYNELQNRVHLISPSYILGGYLRMSFLLPFSIVTSVGPSLASLIYAVVVSIALFALGLWLYCRRKSELATNAVPERPVHRLLQCLITLPTALGTILNIDEETGLVCFVCTLLIFYLYELLTTKKVKRMLRCSAWLGVVVGVCVLCVGVLHVNESIDRGERTDAARIEEVRVIGVSDPYRTDNVLTSYERYLIRNTLSHSDEVIAIVSDAWEHTQNYPGFNSYTDTAYQRMIEIHLSNGWKIYRYIRFTTAQYEEMLSLLQDEIQPPAVPADNTVKEVLISQNLGTVRLTGEWKNRMIEALKYDFINMTQRQREEKISGYVWGGTIQVVTEDNTFQYWVDKHMPCTFDVLYDLFSLPTFAKATVAQTAINGWDMSEPLTLELYTIRFDRLYAGNVAVRKGQEEYVKELLATGVSRAESGSSEGTSMLMYINYRDNNSYSGKDARVVVPVRLTMFEREELKEILGLQ